MITSPRARAFRITRCGVYSFALRTYAHTCTHRSYVGRISLRYVLASCSACTTEVGWRLCAHDRSECSCVCCAAEDVHWKQKEGRANRELEESLCYAMSYVRKILCYYELYRAQGYSNTRSISLALSLSPSIPGSTRRSGMYPMRRVFVCMCVICASDNSPYEFGAHASKTSNLQRSSEMKSLERVTDIYIKFR